MRASVFALLLATLLLPACRAPESESADRGPKTFNPPPIRGGTEEPLPAYGEVVRRYNAAASPGLDRFSARVGVELAYTDADGTDRRESGSGRLLFRRPLDTALSVSVIGNQILWAGSNAERWWVFSELHKTGRLNDGLVAEQTAGAGGLPFRPDAVPLVLGLRPLDPDAAPPTPAVERLNGFWLVEPPGVGARLLIDPRTARPVRVDLLDADGRSRVVTRLDGETPVAGGPPGATLPTLIDAWPADGGTRLTLIVREATADDKLLDKDALFELEALKAFYPRATRNPAP